VTWVTHQNESDRLPNVTNFGRKSATIEIPLQNIKTDGKHISCNFSVLLKWELARARGKHKPDYKRGRFETLHHSATQASSPSAKQFEK
jgi:hypothetical protein